MDLGTFVDVLLGLTLLYLLLALICSAVGELLASVLGWRAKSLRQGIKDLLDDQKAEALYKALKEDPRVEGLTKLSGRHGPSYLSGKMFATAVLGGLTLDSSPKGADWSEHLQKGIANLPASRVRNSLQAMVKEADNKYDDFRKEVASWFDDAMERMSGVYKRRLQRVSLGIALVITLALGADTFDIAARLWNDAGQLAQITVIADQKAQDGLGSSEIYASLEQLRPFPVGWRAGLSWGWPDIIIRILGLLLTTLAVSLGAPFWFNTLQRLNAIRSSGPRPARDDAKQKR